MRAGFPALSLATTINSYRLAFFLERHRILRDECHLLWLLVLQRGPHAERPGSSLETWVMGEHSKDGFVLILVSKLTNAFSSHGFPNHSMTNACWTNLSRERIESGFGRPLQLLHKLLRTAEALDHRFSDWPYHHDMQAKAWSCSCWSSNHGDACRIEIPFLCFDENWMARSIVNGGGKARCPRADSQWKQPCPRFSSFGLIVSCFLP